MEKLSWHNKGDALEMGKEQEAMTNFSMQLVRTAVLRAGE